MENENLELNGMEEVEDNNEVEEATKHSNAGALVAGIAGGFLAYAIIGSGKKLKAFINKKRAERKQAPEDEIIDAEVVVEDADNAEEHDRS